MEQAGWLQGLCRADHGDFSGGMLQPLYEHFGKFLSSAKPNQIFLLTYL